MVGGRLVMGLNKDQDDEDKQNASIDEQLQNVAARIANNAQTDRVRSFEFQPKPNLCILLSLRALSQTTVKEEAVMPSLHLSMTPPHEDGEDKETTPKNDQTPQDDKSANGRGKTHSPNHQYGWTIKDKVILQRWRARDLADTGRTEIADQGIFIDANSKAFIIKGGVADTTNNGNNDQLPTQPTTGPPTLPSWQVIPSGPPDGGPPNGGINNSGPSRRGSQLPIPMRGLGRRGIVNKNRHPNPPAPSGPPGGGGPLSGDGSHNGDPGESDEDENNPQVGYYDYQGNTHATDRSHNRTECNTQALGNHRRQMHDWIERYVEEHLRVCLHLPDGVKAPRLDAKNVHPYTGSSLVADFWTWLKSLVVYLETSQLGGLDRDRERKLLIEPVLTGAAKKWYHDHVIEVDEYANWTFVSVIVGMYDRFIHDSAMQEA
ncbi:hypothetical protein EDD18DRAFT_1349506 [Armillaria luteobubalina]|uniref:Uncharacterized protein n=1 Tax=Armillaria luteobubalina TaxID=153913 RepID=A0AA39QC11_9AGAR|nr:hypothetical protein EDD18DRAFT_1349506 [Armillaria luteobubalina]